MLRHSGCSRSAPAKDIHWFASARSGDPGFGRSPLSGCFSAKYVHMADDSRRRKPPSSRIGSLPNGCFARKSGVRVSPLRTLTGTGSNGNVELAERPVALHPAGRGRAEPLDHGVTSSSASQRC